MRLPLLVSVVGIVLAGCGASQHFANLTHPPAAVDLSVYVDGAHVLVSPDSVGAGPLDVQFTNQTSRSQTVRIMPAGSGRAIKSTAPIAPGESAQLQLDGRTGDYTIQTSSGGGSPTPATLRIGRPRHNGDGLLLQP
jgi:hypothetical protein